MFLLKNKIKSYHWGIKNSISKIMNCSNSILENNKTESEMWIGAYSDISSSVKTQNDKTIQLCKLIKENPEFYLGKNNIKNFGEKLPFLVKIISVGSPLSLQAHPNSENAKLGFQKEELNNIYKKSKLRIYKDNNHKPEMLFALTKFDIICDFKNFYIIKKIFMNIFHFFLFYNIKIPSLLKKIIKILQTKKKSNIKNIIKLILQRRNESNDLINSCLMVAKKNIKNIKNNFFNFHTLLELNRFYPNDPGVIIALLMNRINLKPGDVIYINPGSVHAYLHGIGIEVMAPSDNVIRMGLTSKPINIEEFLKVASFQSKKLNFFSHNSYLISKNGLYPSPFCEFQLQKISLNKIKNKSLVVNDEGPTILIAIQGSVYLNCYKSDKIYNLKEGNSAFFSNHNKPKILNLNQNISKALIFAITVPSKKNK